MDDYVLRVCREPDSIIDDPDALVCRLPVQSERDAEELLSIIGSGTTAGTGYRLKRLGFDLPRIRAEYEAEVANLVREVASRRGTMSTKELARWVSGERVRIARSMRLRVGLSSTVVLEVRDNIKYGIGGRTFGNMQSYYEGKGASGEAVFEKVVTGATSPNTEISQSVVRGAIFLKWGGRVILAIGLTATAYRLLTTPEEQLPAVIEEEAVSWTGGIVGSGMGSDAAMALCLVLGIATEGFGLLACGLIGGIGGGLFGSHVTTRIYYSNTQIIERQARERAIIDGKLLLEEPPLMCTPSPECLP